MKVAIIGGGSIGLLTAFYLSSKHEVTLVTRTVRQRDLIRNYGLYVMRDEVKYKTNCLISQTFSDRVKYVENDLWIIALKQTAIPEFFTAWKEQENLPPILFIQNGLGHLEEASRVMRTEIFGGVITHGAMKISDYGVYHKGVGSLTIGLDRPSSTIRQLLSVDSFFSIYETSNLDVLLKRKLLVNVVVNPLTAFYRVKNGEIITNPKLLERAFRIFKEAISVLGLDSGEWENVVQVVERTSQNESSMFQDIKKGKQTEIQAITGYLLELGNQHGILLPEISSIHKAIVDQERRNRNG